MADELKIPVSAPGAQQAAADLNKVAAAQRQVGAAGEEAARKLEGPYERAGRMLGRVEEAQRNLAYTMQRAGGDTAENAARMAVLDGRASALRDRIGQVDEKLKTSGSSWHGWAMGATAAVAVVSIVLRKLIMDLLEANRLQDELAAKRAGEIREPAIRAMAFERGETPDVTMSRTAEQAMAAGITKETAFDVAKAVQGELGNIEGLDQAIVAAQRFASATGASAGTIAEAIALGKKAGLAQPGQVGDLLANVLVAGGGTAAGMERFVEARKKTPPQALIDQYGLGTPGGFERVVTPVLERLGQTDQEKLNQAEAEKAAREGRAADAQDARVAREKRATDPKVNSWIRGMYARTEPYGETLVELGRAIEDESLDPGLRSAAMAMRDELAPGTFGIGVMGYMAAGAGPKRDQMTRAANLMSVIENARTSGGTTFVGGTHHHYDERRDPAGKANPPAGGAR